MTMENQIQRVPDAVVPKQRKAALMRVLGSLLGLLLLTAAGLLVLAGWGWSVFTAAGPLQQQKILELPKGATRSEIAKRLYAEGVVSDVSVMNAASMLNGLRGTTLKSGEYQFPANATMAQVLQMLSASKVITYKVTVPEGWTVNMALARLNSNDILSGEPVTEIAAAEGTILADTFVFRRGKSRMELLAEMQAAQNHLAEDLWAKRAPDTVLKSKEEMVILASIVEKETAKPEERPRVAAVFLNRLKKGMRLQSDPTIIYGLVGGVGKLDRPLTRADIDGVTPFNTYQIAGLPPSPIANPGRAAMEAVIAPTHTDDIFFVADGTGGHAFAATLEGHNANVKKWREFQKNGLLLPGEQSGDVDTAVTTSEPGKLSPEIAQEVVQQVVQPALPAGAELSEPEEALAAPDAAADPAIDEAAATAEKTQTVPTPVEGDDSQPTGETKPVAAEPPPLPVAKKLKPEPVAKVEVPADAPEKPKDKTVEKTAAKAKTPAPGTVVKVGEKLVPIPLQKKKKK